MKLKLLSSSLHLLLLLSVFSTFIPDETVVNGQMLPQTQKVPCRILFVLMDYTIITKRCKGPKFPHKECCAAFYDLACPYSKDLNDLTTDCLSLMLSHIRFYCRYPAGMFGITCLKGKQFVSCPRKPMLSK